MGDWAGMPTLAVGEIGEWVEHLQRRLVELGYDPGPVDAQFGGRTAAAVESFQNANGLWADGIVGPRTWNVLEPAPAADEAAFQVEPAGAAIDDVANPMAPPAIHDLANLTAGSGSAGDDILNPGSEHPGPEHGGHGEVGAGQKLNPHTAPQLIRKHTGQWVNYLQELLHATGHEPGKVDGFFGPRTEAGVLSFQRAVSIADDGIVGPITWGELKPTADSHPSDPPYGSALGWYDGSGPEGPPPPPPERAELHIQGSHDMKVVDEELPIHFTVYSLVGTAQHVRLSIWDGENQVEPGELPTVTPEQPAKHTYKRPTETGKGQLVTVMAQALWFDESGARESQWAEVKFYVRRDGTVGEPEPAAQLGLEAHVSDGIYSTDARYRVAIRNRGTGIAYKVHVDVHEQNAHVGHDQIVPFDRKDLEAGGYDPIDDTVPLAQGENTVVVGAKVSWENADGTKGTAEAAPHTRTIKW